MKIFTLKIILLIILAILGISLIKLFINVWTYDIGAANLENVQVYLNKYQIQRNKFWNKYSTKFSQINYQEVQFQEKQNSLTIQNRHQALYDEQGQLFEKTIVKVIKLQTQKIQNQILSHFIVKSEQFVQIYYSLSTQNTKSKLKKCINLQNVQINDKIHYFADSNGKIWIISHPNNNVLFIQIYDCLTGKLLKKIKHEPSDIFTKYMINQLYKIQENENGQLLTISFLTYEAHQYLLRINIQKDYLIQNTSINYSYKLQASRKYLESDSSFSKNNQGLKYEFLDPLRKIFNEQFQFLLLKNIKKYFDQVKMLLSSIKIDARWLTSYVNSRIRQFSMDQQPESFEYDIQVMDIHNDCVLNLKYNDTLSTLNSSGASQSSLIKIGKYLINSKTPIFHSSDEYDQYGVLQILKKQTLPTLSQFKRIQIDKSYERQYTSDYYYSVYKLQPNNKLHFMGIGEKFLSFYPTDKIDNEQYHHIRSAVGGVVLHGTKIKGSYEDRNRTNFYEVNQKYFIQANQVLKGVYEAHITYRALYTDLKSNRVQLVSGMSGKAMLTHYINTKEGYQYIGAYLFNNEWWIIEHNYELQKSYLVKYELYVDSANPKQIMSVKRTYGRFENSQFTEEEDDLFRVLQQFTNKYGGFVILEIFRCIDEFYYVQIVNTQGTHLFLARIHFKRFSNRLPKSYGQYSGQLEEQLIVQPKNMVKEKQKIQPFGLVIEQINLFSDLKTMISEKKLHDLNNRDLSKKTNKLQMVHQFELLPYTVYTVNQQSNGKSQELGQDIWMINMRQIIQNAKKQQIYQFRLSAKKTLTFLIGFLIIIMSALIVKLIISGKVQKVSQPIKQQKNNGKKDKSQKKKHH